MWYVARYSCDGYWSRTLSRPNLMSSKTMTVNNLISILMIHPPFQLVIKFLSLRSLIGDALTWDRENIREAHAKLRDEGITPKHNDWRVLTEDASKVLIIGTHMAGSDFLGHLLNSNPGTFYRYWEPTIKRQTFQYHPQFIFLAENLHYIEKLCQWYCHTPLESSFLLD